MVVALADSFFFDVDLDGTRTRLLGFLLVSFTPFLIVAPMIGPLTVAIPAIMPKNEKARARSCGGNITCASASTCGVIIAAEKPWNRREGPR